MTPKKDELSCPPPKPFVVVDLKNGVQVGVSAEKSRNCSRAINVDPENEPFILPNADSEVGKAAAIQMQSM